MKTGIELIAEERKRQIEEEGWTPEHDKEHRDGELSLAARCYILHDKYRPVDYPPVEWPWFKEYWKPTPEDRVKELTKAGALIASEIDRLQNLEK